MGDRCQARSQHGVLLVVEACGIDVEPSIFPPVLVGRRSGIIGPEEAALQRQHVEVITARGSPACQARSHVRRAHAVILISHLRKQCITRHAAVNHALDLGRSRGTRQTEDVLRGDDQAWIPRVVERAPAASRPHRCIGRRAALDQRGNVDGSRIAGIDVHIRVVDDGRDERPG